MKLIPLLILCLTSLVDGTGHGYPSAHAPAHYRPLLHHKVTPHHHHTAHAHFQHHPKPGGATYQKPANQQTSFASSFPGSTNFQKLPLTPLNNFHGYPSFVSIDQDYRVSGHAGLRKQGNFQKPSLSSGTTYQHSQHLVPATFVAPSSGTVQRSSVSNFQAAYPSFPATSVASGSSAFQSHHLTTGTTFRDARLLSSGPLTTIQKQPLVSGASFQGHQRLVPATYVAPSSGTIQKQPLTSGTTFQGHRPLDQASFVVPSNTPVQKQSFAYGASFPGHQRLVPATFVAPSSGSIQKHSLAAGATFQGHQPYVQATFVAPSSTPVQKQPLSSIAGSVHKQSLTSGATFHGHQPFVQTTFLAPSTGSVQKQPLTSGATFQAHQPSVPATYVAPGSTSVQKQPLAPSATSDGIVKGPLTPAVLPPKKPFSFSYTANPVRKVVEVSPQQGVIAGSIPYPVVVQTPTGPKYGTYNQPAALTYKYNATKVHYKPVEAHGYQVSY